MFLNHLCKAETRSLRRLPRDWSRKLRVCCEVDVHVFVHQTYQLANRLIFSSFNLIFVDFWWYDGELYESDQYMTQNYDKYYVDYLIRSMMMIIVIINRWLSMSLSFLVEFDLIFIVTSLCLKPIVCSCFLKGHGSFMD